MKKSLYLIAGILIGAALTGGSAAVAAGIMAERSHHRVVVDGKEVQMEAYVINGNNYVKLRDMGKAVGFEVYWDSVNGCVQVESNKPYTGEAPAKAEPDKPKSHPEPAVPANDADVDAMKQDIIDRTNALRKENGIAALTTSDKLMQAAQVRADEMAASGTYSHTRPDGRNTPRSRTANMLAKISVKCPLSILCSRKQPCLSEPFYCGLTQMDTERI